MNAFDRLVAGGAFASVLIVMVLFPWMWAGRFGAMYDAFGGPLPLSTRLVLMRWPPMLLGLPTLTLLWLALGGKRALDTRRWLLVGAFASGMIGMGLCLWGLYAPIFELARRIH